MSTIMGFATLALLVVIALELYLVIISLARLPSLVSAKDDKKDSPTINVNVGTAAPLDGQQVAKPALLPHEAGTPTTAPPPEPEPEPQPEPEPEAPPPAPPPPHPRASLQATASGLVVVKCPSCQAENSSYRAECFNCGAKL